MSFRSVSAVDKIPVTNVNLINTEMREQMSAPFYKSQLASDIIRSTRLVCCFLQCLLVTISRLPVCVLHNWAPSKNGFTRHTQFWHLPVIHHVYHLGSVPCAWTQTIVDGFIVLEMWLLDDWTGNWILNNCWMANNWFEKFELYVFRKWISQIN